MDGSTTERTMEDWLHQERKAIDARIQAVKAVADQRPDKCGAEITLAFRSLQTAKHWLGEALGIVAGPLPPQFADKAHDGTAA